MAVREIIRTETLPAPIRGWNARDPLAAMHPLDAIYLVNWFPSTSECDVRKGFSEYATGLGDQVESLLPYNDGSSNKLFAAVDTEFYDVTSSGAVGAAVVTGLTNAHWNSVNFANSAGSHFYACNGTDEPQYYDGSSWVAVTGATTPAITGVTTTDLKYVTAHMNRLWFIEKNSMSVWYLGTDAIGGAATEFDLGPVFRMGGELVAMGSWTIDAGAGMDDHAVFISSEGEAVVYKGIDPASDWTRVGSYRIATPIGTKPLVNYKGDLIVITTDGFFPMSQALMTDREQSVALSDKIRDAVLTAATSYKSNYGWEGIFFPGAPFLLFNIPVAVGSQEQYCMNTLTGAWCRFTGMDANCWAFFNDELYFGGSSTTYKAWNGTIDDATNITASGKQAFHYFGVRGRNKRFTAARPLIRSNGTPAISMGMNVDYDDSDVLADIAFSIPSTAGVWDTDVWDTGTWGTSELQTSKHWQTLGGIGAAGALRIKSVSQGIDVAWSATDIVYEVGGVI